MNSQLGGLYDSSVTSTNDDDEMVLLRSTIRIPFSGYRNHSGGSFGSQGSNGCYWSSSPNSSGLQYAYYAYFNSGGGNIAYNNSRAIGFSARCLKN